MPVQDMWMTRPEQSGDVFEEVVVAEQASSGPVQRSGHRLEQHGQHPFFRDFKPVDPADLHESLGYVEPHRVSPGPQDFGVAEPFSLAAVALAAKATQSVVSSADEMLVSHTGRQFAAINGIKGPYREQRRQIARLALAFQDSNNNQRKQELAEQIIALIQGQVALYVEHLEGEQTEQERTHTLKAFMADMLVLQRLTTSKVVRLNTKGIEVLKEIDPIYYDQENNPLKNIPIYGVSFLNNALTYILSPIFLLMLSTAMYGVSSLGLFDAYITMSNPVNDMMSFQEVWNKFVKYMHFGIYWSALYSGTNGFEFKNKRFVNWAKEKLSMSTDQTRSGAQLFAGPRESFGSAVAALDRSLWETLGAPYQTASDYAYSLKRYGIPAVSRKFALDVALVGAFLGGIFELGMGSVSQIIRSIIFKHEQEEGVEAGAGFVEELLEALKEPDLLFEREILPSLAVNWAGSQANAIMAGYKRNDFSNLHWFRLGLGVPKGAFYNAINKALAVTSTEAAWALQGVLIAGMGIYAKLTTSDKVRDWADEHITEFKASRKVRKNGQS